MKTCYFALFLVQFFMNGLFAAEEAGPKKILMAGSLNPTEHKFFESVAKSLAENEDFQNTVYLLTHDVQDTSKFQITQKGERLYTIQVPRLPQQYEAHKAQARINRLDRFRYNHLSSEESNFVQLDVRHTETYFTKNNEGQLEFIEMLKSMNFDVGVGSLYYADSLLMRQLGLNYLKLTEEDIESYTMQFKLNMPVQLSAYPSSKSISNWEYNDLPGFDTQKYRWKMFKDYQRNRLSRDKYMKLVKEALPEELHATIFDNYDQDHAMILQEGAVAGIFYSIMMKPPNIQRVYPIRYEKGIDDETPLVELTYNDSWKQPMLGPIIIINPDSMNPKSAFYEYSDSKLLDNFFNEMKGLPQIFNK